MLSNIYIHTYSRLRDEGAMKDRKKINKKNKIFAPWSYFKVQIPTSFSVPNK